ncbi:MAG: glycosyltransferase family 2 protein [Chthonomonadales bacterium]
MGAAVTILMPTFNHGPTLYHSIGSALDQYMGDFELFVIGDGVPDITREIMTEFVKKDSRIRFFDFPKGERLGEGYRHGVLQEASGDFVCYLSDDDLWQRDHLEQMTQLLWNADFAHSLPVAVRPDNSIRTWTIDISHWEDVDHLMREENRIPLPCTGHTMEFYKKLPRGWHTSPKGIPTDQYFFRQIFAMEGAKFVSGTNPTCIHFPSPERTDWTLDQRLVELEAWAMLLKEPSFSPIFNLQVLDEVVRERAKIDRWYRQYYYSPLHHSLRFVRKYSGYGRLVKALARARRER